MYCSCLRGEISLQPAVFCHFYHDRAVFVLLNSYLADQRHYLIFLDLIGKNRIVEAYLLLSVEE